MTGWRIGWMVLPDDLVRPVECLAQSLYISAPELSQIAAEAALEGTAEMERVREGYRQNRSLLAERLPALGLPFAAPMDGAFYAWVDVSRHTNDSMAFARQMLSDIHVAATPGRDFDERRRENRVVRLFRRCGRIRHPYQTNPHAAPQD